jgi:hypothetical protein
MPIRKQDFYEGAALYSLLRTARGVHIRYQAPFFVIDGRAILYLKYSTRVRSPWSFTFSAEEHSLLTRCPIVGSLYIALVCGEDGIATLTAETFEEVALDAGSAFRIACFRRHGEHYEVSGPRGVLSGKVAPSNWQRILNHEKQE